MKRSTKATMLCRGAATAGLAALAAVLASSVPATSQPAAAGQVGYDAGKAGVPRRGVASKTDLSASRRGPETSPWETIPTSDDLAACMPEVSAPPAEKVVANCTVGSTGGLEHCRLSETKDPRMKGWAACILPKFVARTRYKGQDVEVPLQFTDNTTSK